VDNAIKYSLRGGMVELSVRSTPSEAVVTVEDSGIGIPPESVPRVFDRFFRVNQSRAVDGEGTGLGLSIARTAIVAHGGKVSLDSSQGQGTVVRIRIPSVAQTERPAESSAAFAEK
jgi:two-component system sensor histidine kinase VicK